MTRHLLQLENVTKKFGGISAVNGVSLHVDKGEIVSIIGPNGAGKTTLFNLISGVLPVSSGQISIEGQDLARVPGHRYAQLGIGRTFQNLALFKHGTVVDNLLVGCHWRMKTSVLEAAFHFGRARREEIAFRHTVEKIIDFLEIEHIRDKTVGTLPYGLQKRVELGRALATSPKVLLLDEIVAGMNQEETEDIARFILDTRDDLGVSILLIEHDMHLVMDISDRVHALNFGSTITEGLPHEVQSHAGVIEAYLGHGSGEGPAAAAPIQTGAVA
ncbi:ABC transporter ATP-binding protein [Chachezhania sediminis]|uniref:ABC transporter ATP-binding protein n=1 Tax=Chachezhania sediminis TaxID=2599291 RepID=UPI00131DC4BD|nr:ABC transporter ATP-binding protein [Chachezhania sediminis]